MPLLLAGGEKKFGLGDAEIALMCASHGGEPRHVQLAQPDPPARRVSARRSASAAPTRRCTRPRRASWCAAARSPTALHNNCSGKHAGLLLACRALGLPHDGYTDPGHALQRRIRTLVARYADIPESRITVAVDGCNLPVFRLPLSALAGAYARLMAGRLPGEEPAAAAARARIVRALTKQPFMVAGTGRFTTDFLAAGRGRWIGKEGAEGVYAVGLRPCRARAARRSASRSRSRTAPRAPATP